MKAEDEVSPVEGEAALESESETSRAVDDRVSVEEAWREDDRGDSIKVEDDKSV